jgi:hypothetical protein
MWTRYCGILLGWVLVCVLPAASLAADVLIDSDHDGSPDAFEHFLHTDPNNASSVFGIRGVSALSSALGTRISWVGAAGRPFRIEAAANLDGPWQIVATFQGDGNLISQDLAATQGETRHYFRLTTDFDISLPPWFGPIDSAGFISSAGVALIHMQAWHPLGLDELIIRRGDRILGSATRTGEFDWEFSWAADPTDNGLAPIQAEAHLGDQVTLSATLPVEVNIVLPPQPQFLTLNGDQFVLLDNQGQPIANSLVRADASGNLPPCEYRPMGYNPNGELASFGIRLPEGGRITGTPGSETLEFNKSQVVSGARSVLQIAGDWRTTVRRTLRLGGVSVSDLATIYGHPPGEGLPISILGQFPARLLAGKFSDKGLEAPQFALAPGTLPFGDMLGGFEKVTLGLGDDGFIMLPISGAFPLAQAGGPDATVRIGPENPAWVRLGFDGSLRLDGKARLSFANGPEFEVGLTLNDPIFGMEFRAAKLQASATGWLHNQLPQAASLTAASPADAATLDSATRLLSTKAQAFERYAAGFQPAAPDPSPRGLVVPRPSSPLDVIGLSLLAGAAGLDSSATELKTALDQSARQGSAAMDAIGAARQWFYLERLRLGGLTSTELTAARDEARAALKRRLEKSGEPMSIDQLRDVLSTAVERLQLAQTLNVAIDDNTILSSCEVALAGAIRTFATALGVTDGAFTQPAAGVVSRDRFVIYQDLATLTEIRRDADALGLEIPATALLGESLAQLGLRAETVLRDELHKAEVAGDEMAFRDAMAEYLFVCQENARGTFGGANLPLISYDELGARYGQVSAAAINAPRPARALTKLFHETDRIGKILDSAPANVTFPAEPIQRAYTGLQSALQSSFSFLSGATRDELLNVLLAGNAAARLRDHMAFAPGSPAWEDPSRLSAVDDLLAAKCQSEDDSTSAFKAAQSLFDAADRFEQSADLPRRKLYLLEAQKFVVALRVVALAREAAAPPSTADSILAGGIAIDEIAGGLTYNTKARELSGWGSGKLRLPGLGASFTLARADFNTGGAFSLSAFGSIDLPGSDANSKAGRFSVTPRHPLTLAYTPLDGISIAGGGKLEINGMTYEAWASLDDPEYRFGASFSGLNFDLAQSLRVMIPTWPNGTKFPAAAVRDLNQYVRDFGNSLEELGGAVTTAPAFHETGAPPEFETPMGGQPFAAISAWASAELSDASLQLNHDYSSSISSIIRQLENIKGRFDQAAAGQTCKEGFSLNEAAVAIRLRERLQKAIPIMQRKVPPEPTAELEAKLNEIDAHERAYLLCLFSSQTRQPFDVETEMFRLLTGKVSATGDNTLDVPSDWHPVFVSALDYHRRTYSAALVESGLDPETGNLNGAAVKGLSDEKLLSLTENILLRVNLAAIFNDDSVTHVANGSTHDIGMRAILKLSLERRERLIREAWEVQNTLPQWPESAPLAIVPVDADTARSIREYARRSRELLFNWLEFRVIFERLGLDAAARSDSVLRFSDGSYGPWSANEDEQAGNVGFDQLTSVMAQSGIPQAVVPARLANGSIRNVRMLPIYEGLYGLDRPIGAYTIAQKAAIDRLGFGRVSFAEAPPELQALWRRYELAKLNVTGAATHDQMATLADQFEYEVQTYVATPAANLVLGDGLKLARNLRTLTLAAEFSDAADLKVRFQAALTTLDAPFKAAAAAQKAWWYIAQYSDILLDGADAYINNTATASRQFFSDAASESARASVAILQDLSLLLPSQRPIDLALPGDMRIDQAFGEIRYNRDTHLLAGTFGGSLSFPDIDANFTLVHLDLDNQGHVAIEASASGPLPRVPGARMTGTVSVAGRFGLGTPGQPPIVLEQFATSGSGSLSLPDGVSFDGQFAYDSTTRVLELTGHGNHLDLQLSDHLVLLDGVAGMRFGGVGDGAFPSSGRFEFGGTFGMFRKSNPAQGQPLTPENFHLSAVAAVARLDIQANHVTVSLAKGKLLLPEIFESQPVLPATLPTRAQIAINEALPPAITLALGAVDNHGLRPIQNVTFSGGVTFANLGLKIPNFPGAGARDFQGSLDFGNLTLDGTGAVTAVQAPKLKIDNGFVFFPHPVDPARIEIQAHNIQWKLDGFPTGILRLATDVNILNLDIFNLAVVGAPNSDLTGIEILPPEPNAIGPTLRLFGTLRAIFDNTILTRDATSPAIQGIPAGQFGATVGGQLVIHAPASIDAFPAVDFHLGDLTLTGDFRIGGASGVHVSGLSSGEPAKIILSGLDNIFNLADQPGRRFIVSITGKIVQTGLPGFGLGDARIVFFDKSRPPRFEAPESLVYDGSSWDLAKQLPIELRQARLQFNQRDVPITDLLKPSNLIITTTFRLGFPTLDEPIIGGGVDNVRVTFLPDGTPQIQNLEGIELTLDPGLDIPPIQDLGGTVYITGFSNPANLMMAGRLGGTVNTYKLNFIAAFTTTGPLGLALDVNAGTAGIPLPFGFMFTGAGGGISFLNTSSDPMDLHSYVKEIEGRFQANQSNPPPPATMNWRGFKDWRDKILSQIPTFPPIGSGPVISAIEPGTFPATDPIGCPVNIPPASANIFGMPHPDQAKYPRRYILKFSSIPEETLNKPIQSGGMGITESSIAALGKHGADLGLALAAQVRAAIEANTPPVPSVLGAGARQAALDWLAALEQGFAANFSQEILGLAIDASAQQIYAAIKEKAYAGVTIQDATLSVKGTFTHIAVSAFMNVEGGGMIGTTGSAGVSGRVNFLGLPVGIAELYLSATDVNGNPNPQLNGDITMSLGPLQLGATKASLKAEGAVTGIAAVALQIANTLAPDVRARVMAAIDPAFVNLTFDQAHNLIAQNASLEQRAAAIAMFDTAFMGAVLRQPPGTLTDTLLGQIASLFDQVNPELVICADSTVKFGGLKVSNGLASMKFRMRKTGREAYFDIAPMGFIGYGTPLTLLTSGIDRAALSYAETFPDVTGLLKKLLNGRLSSPEAIATEARDQVAAMLENSTITGSYEISPLGMNLFRAQMRLINPDLTDHPVVRNNNATSTDDWIAPGTGTLTDLPRREELLLQAVKRNVLSDVFWKGKGSNLADLYDGSIPGLQGRTLTHDYFPHGGVAMAAMLNIPRILTTLPRKEWAELNDASAVPFARLQALRTIMHDYFGSTVQQGNFMAYVPLPNPPAMFDANGAPIVPPPSINPLDLIESLKTFDPTKVHSAALWELDKSFAYLNLNGQLIDIPIGEVDLVAYGPDATTGAPARFSGTINFPPDSWAGLLFGPLDLNASVTGQGRTNPRLISDAIDDLKLQDTLGAAPTDAQIIAALPGLLSKTAEVIAQDFPRVELRATTTTLHPPAQWNWPQLNLAQGTFNLYAYSPEFLSVLPPSPSPLELLQKNGGIAMDGNFNFAGIATASGQLLIEPPTSERPRPRAFATLSGKTVSLPFGGLDNALVQFDTESATFLTISGALHTDLDLAPLVGWPVHIAAGANVVINNHTATFTFLNAGATATVTADYTDPLHPVFTINGQIAFNSLTTQLISIVPQANTGSKLLVDVGAPGPRLVNGRVIIAGLFNQAADLPEIVVDNALNFGAISIKAPLANASVQLFSVDNLTWKIQRVGGLLSISVPSGFLHLNPLGANFGVTLGGTINPDGTFKFTAPTLLDSAVPGLPIDTLKNGALVTFSNGVVDAVGSVTGGLLANAILPGISQLNNVKFTLSPNAITSLTGAANVPLINLGNLKIRPPSGFASLTASLTMAGLNVPAGLLHFDPFSSTIPFVSTPALVIPPLTSPFATTIWSASVPSGRFAGFNLGPTAFVLERAGLSPILYRLRNVAFQAPLPTGFANVNFTVSGGLLDGIDPVPNLPITTLPALIIGRFTFENALSAPNLTAAGINLPAARLRCDHLWRTPLAPPSGSLLIPSTGDITIPNFNAGDILPSLGALNGFTLKAAHFDVVKSGVTMNLLNFAASLPAPGFIADAVPLTAASIPATGAITLNGAAIPHLSLDNLIIHGPGDGAISSVLSSDTGWLFTAGTLNIANLFSAPAPLGTINFTIPPSAIADTTFGSFNMAPNLRGYSFGSSAVKLERVGGATRLNFTGGALPLPGGPTLPLTGTISTAGIVSLSGSFPNNDFYGFPVNANFSLAANAATWSSIILNSSPRAWWKMDDSGKSLTLLDAAGGTPVLNGVTTSTATMPATQQSSGFRDGSGLSMRFDGVGDFYSIADNPDLEGGSKMSVACWFKVNQFTVGKPYETIISKGDDSWRIAQDGAANSISFDCNSASSLHILRASNVNVNDGHWHHVAATYDGDTKRLYIDGVLRGSAAFVGPIRDSSYPVVIGANAQQANRNWNGWIDEVVFWNRAIDASLVNTMYNRGNGLDLTFNAIVNLRLGAQQFTPTFNGSINSSGEFKFGFSGNASLFGFGFNSVNLDFSRNAFQTPNVILSGAATLNALPAAPFNFNPRFNAQFTRSGTDTIATLTANSQPITLGGYSPGGSGFNMRINGALGTTTPIAFSNFTFANQVLSALNLPALSGAIQPNGSFALFNPFNWNITLSGFNAPSASVNFSNSGLSVSGGLDLNSTVGNVTRSFGNVSFSGILNTGGGYSLTGNGSLNIGGYSTDPIDLTLNSSTRQITASTLPNLHFGGLTVAIQNFSMRSDDFQGSMNHNFGPTQGHYLSGHLDTSFSGNISLNFNFSTGTLDGSVGGTWNWNVTNFLVPNNFLPSGSFNVHGGINDSGLFTVDNNSADGSSFFAPFWGGNSFIPPPTWFWGSLNSEGFDLF